MSNKKQIRRQRREQKQKARRKVNPAVTFLLFVAAALAALALVAYFVDTKGTPPRPGAVWSEEHGHWH